LKKNETEEEIQWGKKLDDIFGKENSLYG